MSKKALLFLFTISLSILGCSKPTSETYLKESVVTIEKIADQFQQVHDEESAKRAVQTLEVLFKHLAQLDKKMDAQETKRPMLMKAIPGSLETPLTKLLEEEFNTKEDANYKAIANRVYKAVNRIRVQQTRIKYKGKKPKSEMTEDELFEAEMAGSNTNEDQKILSPETKEAIKESLDKVLSLLPVKNLIQLEKLDEERQDREYEDESM